MDLELNKLLTYLQLVYGNFSHTYFENNSMFEIAKEWERGNRNISKLLLHEKEGYLLKNWFQSNLCGQDVVKFVKDAENLLCLICSRFDMSSLPKRNENVIGEYLLRHGDEFNGLKEWVMNNITIDDVEQCYLNENISVPVSFTNQKEEVKKDIKVLLRKNVQNQARIRGQASVNNVYEEEKKGNSVRSLDELRKIMNQN